MHLTHNYSLGAIVDSDRAAHVQLVDDVEMESHMTVARYCYCIGSTRGARIPVPRSVRCVEALK